MVTSQDMTVRYPHPQCHELTTRKLGVNVEERLVFETAAGGILTARAAGARVIVISETHDDSSLELNEAPFPPHAPTTRSSFAKDAVR